MIKTLAKNKYKVVVEIGKIDGKRSRITKIVNGIHKEAKLKEADMIREVQNNQYKKPKKITLHELSNMFIEDYCKSNLKENTTYGYTVLLKNILSEMGNIQIENITPYTLQKFYNRLFNEYNYSSNTVAHYYTLLNNIFRKAVIWKFIKENPNATIDKPKIPKKTIKFYDYNQVNKLLEALKNEPITYRAMIVLCLDSGMRREEINGLKWSDINFLTNEIAINRVRLIVNKKEIVETPKTECSKRIIVVAEQTMNLIRELKEYQNKNRELLQDKWLNTDYVFVTQEGKPYYPDMPSKILKRILKRYNLEKITFHQLRHTSASLLINSNADITSVSARLGHANTSTTLNIYSHALDESKKEMANKMSTILKSV